VSVNLEALAGAVRALADRAAAAILEVYRGDFAVRQKDDRTPLTAADLAAHRIITAGLQALTPDWPVLSEEAAEIAWEQRRDWHCYWLVDPLDGTREFVKRNDEFTVNIALIEAGRPILGVIQVPVGGETGYAWRGGGAWLSIGSGTPRRIATRRMRTPLTVAGSRSHASERMGAMLARLGEVDLIPLGSSLKFLRVADGSADLYVRLGPTSEWDTAAGQILLEEAGGALTAFDGRPFTYNARPTLLNGDFIACGDRSVDWPRRLLEDAAR
jgi:3'(2'), 5'-bisphosphate nucleotidase